MTGMSLERQRGVESMTTSRFSSEIQRETKSIDKKKLVDKCGLSHKKAEPNK